MITELHQPTRLDDALALIRKGATPLAGATALYTAKTERDLTLVDIKRLGLGEVVVERRRLLLGATVTLSELGDAEELPGVEGALLRRAARGLSLRSLRNAITLGGNIVHVAYWADMPVVLLALDAELELRHAGKRPVTVDVATALEAGRRPWQGGLLTRVVVPRREGTWSFGYERFARTSGDYALATVCVLAERDGERLASPRVVVGALQARPVRVAAVEEMLAGEAPTPALIDAAAAKLAATVKIAPNFRTEADYRKKLVQVLGRRAISTCVEWMKREE